MVLKTKPAAKPIKTTDERLEHQRLTSLVNSMADAVIAVDQDIKVVLYNAAALNIFDVNSIKAGSSLSSLLKPIDKDNQPHDITAMVRQAAVPTTSRDLLLPYPDGSKINLYMSIAPVHLGYGATGQRGYVLLLRDITREKSLEEERDEFISVVSHELRTPIAISEGNIGNAQFIAEKSGDMTAIKQALKEAHNQILFLADMINDLSTLSRAERGTLKLEVEPINVHELVTELASNYTPDAEAKHLQLKTVIDPQLELLQSSKLYVREVLQNFITNAIKYTAKGHVTVEAKTDPKGVIFAISDSGIGISKGDQEQVFDKFFRSEDYRTRQANGTGLGLYVTMKLARLLHAEIELKSELNEGSTFTVFIPNLQ
jgi:PAS domain S-box-containing protein